LLLVCLLFAALPLAAQSTPVEVGTVATIELPEGWMAVPDHEMIVFASDEASLTWFLSNFQGVMEMLAPGAEATGLTLPEDSVVGFIGYGSTWAAIGGRWWEMDQPLREAPLTEGEVDGRPARSAGGAFGELTLFTGTIADGPNSLFMLGMGEPPEEIEGGLASLFESIRFDRPPTSSTAIARIPVGTVAELDVPSDWVTFPAEEGVMFGTNLDSLNALQDIIARIFNQITTGDAGPTARPEPENFAAGYVAVLSQEFARANAMDVESLRDAGMGNTVTELEIDGRPAVLAITNDGQFTIVMGAVDHGDYTLFIMAAGDVADIPEGGFEGMLQTLRFFAEPQATRSASSK
jgi:hypothetical protein